MKNNENINKSIGARIKFLREQKGEYQKETAESITKMGVSLTDGQLGMYEIGIRKTPPHIIKALAQYFEVSADYILGVDEKTSKYKHLDNAMIGRVGKIEILSEEKKQFLDTLLDSLVDDYTKNK